MTETSYPHGSQHPAVIRLRSEFEAARRGVGSMAALDAEHRDRMVAEMRTGLPDVASRAAHEVGTDAAVAEIRRFAAIDVRDLSTIALWGTILESATEAAAAAR